MSTTFRADTTVLFLIHDQADAIQLFKTLDVAEAEKGSRHDQRLPHPADRTGIAT